MHKSLNWRQDLLRLGGYTVYIPDAALLLLQRMYPPCSTADSGFVIAVLTVLPLTRLLPYANTLAIIVS